MPDTASQRVQPSAPVTTNDATDDYPVREYIGSMARQLAMMARADGADALGDLLDAAVRQATRV